MATLTIIDGFGHQTVSSPQAGSGFQGTYGTVVGTPTVDTTTLRHPNSKGSLKCIGDGATAQTVRWALPTSTRLTVGSFYIMYSAAPNVTTTVLSISAGAGGTMQITTDGKLNAIVTGGVTQVTAASLADGLWHLVDFRYDTSGATATIDWQVDGAAQTQATKVQAAADQTPMILGLTTTTTTMTVFYSDWCVSFTTGDYPLGAHHVNPLFPTGMGTSTLGTTNPIVNESGNGTNLYLSVDDWASGAADTTTYVTYTSTTLGDAASNFAEFTMTDVVGADTVFWGVTAFLAGFSSGTTTNTAACQVLDAHAGTRLIWIGNVAGNTGLLDYSGSSTVLGYQVSSAESSTLRAVVAPPGGGWTATTVNALVIQWGISSNVASLPRLSSVMLEYVSPGSGISASKSLALTGVG